MTIPYHLKPTTYFLSPSFFTRLPYERLFVVSKYFRCLRRSATSPRSPRRPCLSLRFLSKCTDSSSIRRVRRAICTSGEPVSLSCRCAFETSLCFLRFVSIAKEYHVLGLHARLISRAEEIGRPLLHGGWCCRRGLNLHEFDIEDQRGIRRDHDSPRGRVLDVLPAVPECRRNDHPSLTADVHAVHPDLEAGDDAGCSELEDQRFIAVCLGAVEDRAVLKHSSVENRYDRAGSGFWPPG